MIYAEAESIAEFKGIHLSLVLMSRQRGHKHQVTLGTSSPSTPVAQPFGLCKDPSQEKGEKFTSWLSLDAFLTRSLGPESLRLLLLIKMNLSAHCSSSCSQAWKVLRSLESVGIRNGYLGSNLNQQASTSI